MEHPAGFLASALPFSPDHADVTEVRGDPAADHCARDDGGYVPALSAARTGPWTPPPAHGRVLVAAAARPGEK
ncbi:hypothetical protein ACFY3G_53165 [Streptomyces phaeochromogenes]|uniref:hypothetical protein n=1 Tax=Streptomyces phaeochromogenes TaxID=1923 RepID=UPI00369898FE